MNVGNKTKLAIGTLSMSIAGLAALLSSEGTKLTAYRDPVGIPTICSGHTKTAQLGQTVTKETCTRLLEQDTSAAQAAVKRLVKVPVTQDQYDTLVDFVFNVGAGNFASSTLLKKINAGQCKEAAAEFPRWNKAKGRVLPGLVIRRAQNKAAWEAGCAE